MLQRLFVYGTLAPGRPNEHVLSAVPGTWQRGTVRGRLMQAGWGAEQGYPGVVIDEIGSQRRRAMKRCRIFQSIGNQ